ncbi:hypothetical protein [Streptomyces bobili]
MTAPHENTTTTEAGEAGTSDAALSVPPFDDLIATEGSLLGELYALAQDR